MRKDRLDGFGAVALLAVTILLASNQILVKLAVVGIQPVFLAGARSALAIFFLWAWMAWNGRSPRHLVADFWPGLAIGLTFSAEFLGLFVALDHTSVGHASILFYSMPVWFAVIAHYFLGERITPLRAVGLFLAFLGAATVILVRSGGGGDTSLFGDLCALGGALGWAATAYLARATRLHAAGPEMPLFWMLLVSAPVLILISFGFGPLLRDVQPIHWAILLFQASVIATGGFVAWLWLLQTYPSSTVASFSFLSPVIAILMGILFFGEAVTISLVVASVLVAVGITLINRRA
jgi:drug/metabolite transporter (DMT)-like permease